MKLLFVINTNDTKMQNARHSKSGITSIFYFTTTLSQNLNISKSRHLFIKPYYHKPQNKDSINFPYYILMACSFRD